MYEVFKDISSPKLATVMDGSVAWHRNCLHLADFAAATEQLTQFIRIRK